MGKYDIAAYIWPAYTGRELRARMFWENGEGEWQTVRRAKPKFLGHAWPRVPLWGYVDEADPKIMEMQIDEATRHGVNVFIYDYYWYDRRPFLEQCLDDGFLGAENNKKMKFYLMWANHNANHLWDRRLSGSECGSTVIWQGGIDFAEFRRMASRLMDKYFHLENYYKINGCPVFMIYEIATFVSGMGSMETAKEALLWMRAHAREMGFPDLHIQITARGSKTVNISGIDSDTRIDSRELIELLGINSFTHYQYVHMTNVDRDFSEVAADAERIRDTAEEEYGIPYYAHVSCGWDNNARFKDVFKPGIIKNNTPEAFEKALRGAKEYTDKIIAKDPTRVPLITVNSWNEWTEASYLEPDNIYGYGYLDAIKRVFSEEN